MIRCLKCDHAMTRASSHCEKCGSHLEDPEAVPTLTDAQAESSPSPGQRSSDHEHGRFLPGTIVANRYRIVSLVGQGGMGEVYRADDLKLGQPVALKFLPANVNRSSRAFEHFITEVRLSRQIAHPNVCRVYDIGDAQGQHFLTMEFIDGEDLRALLRRIGRIPPDSGTRIAHQLCAGLSAAHLKGVIHRDLKPANVMIDGMGQAKITDFGIARLAESSPDQSEFAGTPAYMAPEQILHGQTSIQSDLYSLGLILHTLFTGEPIHQTNEYRTIRKWHEENGTPPRPSSLVPELNHPIDRAIAQCLEKKPQDRPESSQAISVGLPGGDPLAAFITAGETPSPELVASAGGRGIMDLKLGVACLLSILVGLLICCALASRSHAINQYDTIRHPEVLADRSLELFKAFGYHEAAPYWNDGFYFSEKSSSPTVESEEKLRYWRRHSPSPLVSQLPYNLQKEKSFARVSAQDPPWGTIGEYGIQLDPHGQLISFRSIPPYQTASNEPSEINWESWLTPELVGSKWADLEPELSTSSFPHYLSNHAKAWKHTDPDGEPMFYVLADAVAGRLTYFSKLTPEEFDAGPTHYDSWVMPALPGMNQSNKIFFNLMFWTVIGAYGASLVVAWKQLRSGKCDRKGVFWIASATVTSLLLTYILIADHHLGIEGFQTITRWVGAGLFTACVSGALYAAGESLIRKLWPQSLISFIRLIDGRWTDPLVGKNFLFGTLYGIGFLLAFQLPFFAPKALGITPDTHLHPSNWGVDSTRRLLGLFCYNFPFALQVILIQLLTAMAFRAIARNRVLTAVLFITFWGIVLNGVYALGLLGCLSYAALSWTVLTRFGILTGIIANFVYLTLAWAPLTLDFSNWYASQTFGALGLVLTLAIFGFYTSTRPTNSRC